MRNRVGSGAPGARQVRRVVAGALAVTTALAAGVVMATGARAATAPTWTSATTLSANGSNDTVLSNDHIDAAMGSTGAAAVGWVANPSNAGGSVTAAYRAAQGGATWETAGITTTASPTSEPRVAVAANGDAVMAWNQSNGLYTAWRPAGANQSWTAAQEVAPSAGYAQCGSQNCAIWGFSVAIDAKGNAIAGWSEPTGSQVGAGTPYVAYRPAGATSTWSAPQAVPLPAGTNGSGAPQVAFDANNDALAVLGVCGGGTGCYTWGTFGVYYYDRPVDTGAFGTNSFTLSGTLMAYTAGNGYGITPDVAVGPDGSAAVSWYQPYGSSYLAYRPAGAASFDAPAQGDYGTVSVDPAGEAFAAEDGHDFVHPAGSGGTWSEVATGPFVDNGNWNDRNIPSDSALSSSDQGVVVGTHWNSSNNDVGTVAAVRGTDGTWSSLTTLSTGSDAGISERVTTDGFGDGVVAWVENANGSDVVRVAGLIGSPGLTQVTVPATAVQGTAATFSVVPVDVWNTVADSDVTWTFTNESDPTDAGTATGTSVSHTFSGTGTYDVSVTAVDSNGSQASSPTEKVAVSPPTLTVSPTSGDGAGGGRIVSTVGSISCGSGASVCSEPVPYANGAPGSVTLNAVPDTSSYLSAWHGCDDDTKVTCTVTVPTAKTVAAFFDTCPLAGTCQPFTGPDTSVSTLCPTGGTTQGASLVTLTGKDLVASQIPSFDGIPATVVSVSADHTSMKVTTPPHAAGKVTVSIPNLYTGTFTYEDAAPTLTGPPNVAVPYTGAGAVTLSGTNLFDINEVYSTAAMSDVPTTGYHANCDGTQLTVTPPDVTFVGGAGSLIHQDDILVTTPNGTNSDFFINRTLPYTQDGGQVVNGLTPDWVDALPASVATQAFTDTFPDDNGGTVDVTVPAGALPSGTVLNVYSGHSASLVSQMPSGVTVVGAYAVAWTAPDGSHPAPSSPVIITVHDPSITPSKPVFASPGSGNPTALPVTYTVPAGVHDLLLRDNAGHWIADIPVTPGQVISGGQVIAAGGGNVIAAGGGNVIAAGGGNFTIANFTISAVIAAGGGNVIAAGAGNVIAAGAGNVIAAGGGNVVAAGGGNVIAAGGGNVIAAGGGNVIAHDSTSGSNFADLIAVNGAGVQTDILPNDPEIVVANAPAAPGAPTNVSATVSGTTATVSWTAPSPGGAAISGYSVQVYDSGQQIDNAVFGTADTTQPISGLTPAHTYTFTVEAFNGGYGPASAQSPPVTVPVTSSGAPSGTGSPAPGTSVAAGGTYDSSSTPPSASNPVVVHVTTPVAGSISVGPATGAQAPTGFDLFGQSVQITAPLGSDTQPLALRFDVDRSAIPAGVDDSELTVTRDGTPAGSCPGATTVSSDAPCVTSVVDHGSYVTITVLSTHASTWSEVAPVSDRLAGADRVGTAIAVSCAYFGAGQAKAAVLTRDDAYPDALAGAPLAAAKGGPLLLTGPAGLSAGVAAELTRALAPGATVYLLGGTAALSPAVDQAVQALGFTTVRLSGPDRYATAVAVAQALGSPGTVFLASGTNFPDALSAGAAAAHVGGVVLLTDGATQSPTTAAYLAQHPQATLYAIGGPAALASPVGISLVGPDRYATATAVAARFFPGAAVAGLASGTSYADALAAGAVLGARGEPLLLTDPGSLSAATAAYIATGISQLHTFGGPAAVAFNPTPAQRGSVRQDLAELFRGVRL